MSVPTPHNEGRMGDIAPTVIMSGDPLRSKFIADNFFDNVSRFNEVRGMLGFTGYYKGHKVSTMGHGMGMPSIGIYTYELFNFYGVENIIRVGSAGGIGKNVGLRDIVIAMGASTDSAYGRKFNLPGSFAPVGDFTLLEKAAEIARKQNLKVKVGNILSSDYFYVDSQNLKKWSEMGVLAVEMEAAALYMNAAQAGKRALCICTVSDIPFTGEGLSAEDRKTTFTQMMELALDLAIEIAEPAGLS